MSKNTENVREISREEMTNISGGYVVKVNPKDIEKEKLELKKYWVVDNTSGKILNSFDKYEDAVASDAVAHSNKDWVYKVPNGDLKNHIFKSLDDDSLVYKMW